MTEKQRFRTDSFTFPPSPPTASIDSSSFAAPSASGPPGAIPYPMMTPLPPPVDTPPGQPDPFDLAAAKITAPRHLQQRISRFVAPTLVLLLLGTIALLWLTPTASSSPSPSSITQQSFGNSSTSTTGDTGGGGDLHVYVTGAVKHPGVYDLPAGARVYQLIQAAGGTLPNANLVALNMAAPLTDGQEVYVISNGEIPPTYLGGVPGPGTGTGSGSGTPIASGQLININTASSDEMRTALHISSATAQKIIDYRTQYGPYTSVDQLLQVVSKEIYDKIKNEVTV
jgi:competence ComEA-like helix-hairpin-helix protein